MYRNVFIQKKTIYFVFLHTLYGLKLINIESIVYQLLLTSLNTANSPILCITVPYRMHIAISLRSSYQLRDRQASNPKPTINCILSHPQNNAPCAASKATHIKHIKTLKYIYTIKSTQLNSHLPNEKHNKPSGD